LLGLSWYYITENLVAVLIQKEISRSKWSLSRPLYLQPYGIIIIISFVKYSEGVSVIPIIL